MQLRPISNMTMLTEEYKYLMDQYLKPDNKDMKKKTYGSVLSSEGISFLFIKLSEAFLGLLEINNKLGMPKHAERFIFI